MQAVYFLSGRIIYAGAMTGFGVVCLVDVDFLNSLQPVPAWVPGRGLLAILSGLVLVIAGVAVMTNLRTRPAALAIAVLFVSVRVGDRPAARSQRLHRSSSLALAVVDSNF